MLQVADIFTRQQGQSFDLTQGVDIVNFFNAGVANPINQISQQFEDLDIQSEVRFEDSTAEQDLIDSETQRQSSTPLFAPIDDVDTQLGFQTQAPVETNVGDFSAEPTRATAPEVERATITPSRPQVDLDIPQRESFQAANNVRVLDVTRDLSLIHI